MELTIISVLFLVAAAYALGYVSAKLHEGAQTLRALKAMGNHLGRDDNFFEGAMFYHDIREYGRVVND